MQLTDLHYGEGPETDHLTDLAIKTLLDFEKPDFVANTGDVLSGYNWHLESRFNFPVLRLVDPYSNFNDTAMFATFPSSG